MNRIAICIPILALTFLAGCGGAPVGGPDAADGPDFELRVRRDGASASARADTSSATLAQRMTIRTPFVYWDERPHPAMPANQHLVLISVVVEPKGPTWLNDLALQCDASILGQAWALVGGQRVRITPIDMDGPGAYSYAADLLQAHDGGSGTPVFAQTAEARDGDTEVTDYTVQAGSVTTWTFGTAGPAQSLPGYAVGGVTQRDPDVGMAWGFLVPANATEVCIGGKLLGTGRTAVNGPVGYASMGFGCWIECFASAGIGYLSLPDLRQTLSTRQIMFVTGQIHELAISWDGTRIAYSECWLDRYGGVWGTESIRLGTSTHKGAQVIAEGRYPSWSPDGSQIAFHRAGPSGTSAIWVMDATPGAEARVLYDDPVWEETCPAWHPNGSRIVFTSTKDRGFCLYTMSPDGTGIAPLGGLYGGRAAWSFDGRMLAYDRGGWVYVANADGSGERRVARGEAPKWSPSGLSLLALRSAAPAGHPYAYQYDGPVRALYSLDLETGEERSLAGPHYVDQGLEPNRCGATLSITSGAWKPVWQ